jgi:hypothetical protein
MSANALAILTSQTYTLSDITETGDDGNLTGEHDIGGSLDTIDEGFSASVLPDQRWCSD